MNPDTYLGDGLYASFDGYQIRLYTLEGQQVFIDLSALSALFAFAKFAAELRAKEST